MAENLRTAVQRTIVPQKRIMKPTVATAVVLAATALLAGPTTAASTPSLTVEKTLRLNADGGVQVKGTFTCSGGRTNTLRNSGLQQGDASSYVSPPKTAVLVICDGKAHPYTVDIPNTESFPFQPGPAQFSSNWLLYGADGSNLSAEVVNAPVTLQE